MSWNDDVVPFRFGGDNSRAGQQEIRYGPRLRDDAMEQSKRASIMNYTDKLRQLHELVEKFNSSSDPSGKQEALKKVAGRLCLSFPRLGKTPTDGILNDYFFRKRLRNNEVFYPEHLIRISEGQLILKDRQDDNTYRTMRVFPLNKIQLELRGHNEKNWQKSKLEVHVTLPEDERVTSWRKAFFGW